MVAMVIISMCTMSVLGVAELTVLGVCVGVEGAVCSHPLPSAPPLLVTPPSQTALPLGLPHQSRPPKDTSAPQYPKTKSLREYPLRSGPSQGPKDFPLLLRVFVQNTLTLSFP